MGMSLSDHLFTVLTYGLENIMRFWITSGVH